MSRTGVQCRGSFVFRLNILLPFEYLGSYVAYRCTMSRLLRVSIEYFAAIEYLGSYVTYRCTMPWLLRVSIEYFAALSIWDLMSCIGAQCRDSFVFRLNILLPFEYLGSYVAYRCTMPWLLRVSFEYLGFCHVSVRNADHRIFRVSLHNRSIPKFIRTLP